MHIIADKLTYGDKLDILNWFYGLNPKEPIRFIPGRLCDLVMLGKKDNPDGCRESRDWCFGSGMRYYLWYSFDMELICPICGDTFGSSLNIHESEYPVDGKLRSQWYNRTRPFEGGYCGKAGRMSVTDIEKLMQTRIVREVYQYPAEYCPCCSSNLRKILVELPRTKRQKNQSRLSGEWLRYLTPNRHNPSIDLAKAICFHKKIKDYGKS